MSSQRFINYLREDFNEDNIQQEYIVKYLKHLYTNFINKIKNYRSLSYNDNIPEILWNEKKQNEIYDMYKKIKSKIFEDNISIEEIIYFVEMIDKIGIIIYYTTFKVSEYLDEKEFYKPEIKKTNFDDLIDRIKELKKDKQRQKYKYEIQINKLKENNNELVRFVKNVEYIIYILIIGMFGIIIYKMLS